jgi:tetratricopeptide (TPR) repeat protein
MNFAIVHKIDSVLYHLFPEIKNIIASPEKTKKFFTDFYTIDGIPPEVNISEDQIQINLDIDRITTNQEKLKQASQFAEKGDYERAKQILEELIENNPYNSEYYRIYGQIQFDLKNYDEAINYLIDSLKYDPENKYALLLLGNIYLEHHLDSETAINFYNKVIELDPEEYIAIYNIGANLLKSNKVQEAKSIILKSIKINPTYPNALYSMAQIYEHEGNQLDAFNKYKDSISTSSPNSHIHNSSIKKLIDLSQDYYNKFNSFNIVLEFKEKLEERAGKEIILKEDTSLPYNATIEIAEQHKKDYHLLRYNPENKYYEHLVLHELVHLYLITLARESNNNKFFVYEDKHEEKFIEKSQSFINKLKTTNMRDDEIILYMKKLFSGLKAQIHSSPIDLFVEDFIFDNFREFRPIQFLSYSKIMDDYISASNLFNSDDICPYFVREAQTIMNMVTALDFQDLYGINLLNQFKASLQFKQKARQLYKMFTNIMDSKEPGIEYDLIHKWAYKLGIRNLFDLIDESEFRANNWSTEVLTSIASDPMNLKDEEANASKDNRMAEEDDSGKMAVTMFCLSAIQELERKTPEQIKEIAFEIAQLARMGIDPNEIDKRLHLASIPGKTFSPRQLLAYMYVAWKKHNPDLDTGIDYEEEYQMARQILEE